MTTFLVDRDRAVGIAEEHCLAEASSSSGVCRPPPTWCAHDVTTNWSCCGAPGSRRLRRARTSGRPKVLHLMNKDFQKLDTIYTAAEKLSQAGIRPSFNMIFGFPGEGEKERRESVALIMDICRRYPGREFWTNIFTPYPGAPDHATRLRVGHRRAENAGRLGRFLSALHTFLPWLKGRKHQRSANHARISARRVQSRSDRSPPQEFPATHGARDDRVARTLAAGSPASTRFRLNCG